MSRLSIPVRDESHGISFARNIAGARGKVTVSDIMLVQAAGYGQAQIVEIVLMAPLSLLTNITNNLCETDIDFPDVHASAA